MLNKLAHEMVDYISTCAEDGITPSMWDALSFERDLKKALRDQEGVSSWELRHTQYTNGKFVTYPLYKFKLSEIAELE